MRVHVTQVQHYTRDQRRIPRARVRCWPVKTYGPAPAECVHNKFFIRVRAHTSTLTMNGARRTDMHDARLILCRTILFHRYFINTVVVNYTRTRKIRDRDSFACWTKNDRAPRALGQKRCVVCS